MAEEQVVVPKKYACCQNDANLEECQTDKPGLIIRVCKECGRRHFELTADPGRFGFKGASV